MIPEQSGPPPPYDTVVSKDDLIIEPLIRALNMQSAQSPPINLLNKQQGSAVANQSNSTPIHECCCCTNTNENFEYIKKCKSCGKEIETKHSSMNRNVDYCDCTETDTSITSINQLTSPFGDDTPMNDVEFEFVDDNDDDNNNNNEREFLSSTSTLVGTQQENISATTMDESEAIASTSMLNDFANNNYDNNNTNTINNPYSSQLIRQFHYKRDRIGNNLHHIAKLDKTGLPTYDTAIILAAVAAASRGSSPQLKRKNNNLNG